MVPRVTVIDRFHLCCNYCVGVSGIKNTIKMALVGGYEFGCVKMSRSAGTTEEVPGSVALHWKAERRFQPC